MDYGTFFVTNVISVTAFAIFFSVLAVRNRRVAGAGWLAGGIVVGLAKLVLQGLEGKVPTLFSSMLANELYIVSFMMQFMGMRWFVVRKPLRSPWPWVAIGVLIAVYSGMFLARIPYSGNIMNIPFLAVCGASAWVLLKHGRGPFAGVSGIAAAIFIADMLVAGYRAILTNLRYMRPWETVNAHTDPRWLYSLTAMAFLATFMVMCDIWFLVTELNRELTEQARIDPLTGALNRRALEEAALRETSRSIRQGVPLCMVLLDIDHFKRVNDRFGHAVGDRVLQELVARVKCTLRAQDLVARTGGEEFTVLMPETPAMTGLAAAERLRGIIETLELPRSGEQVHITVSAGVAQFEPSLGGWEEMMRRADWAMYRAKARGRNVVEVGALEIA